MGKELEPLLTLKQACAALSCKPQSLYWQAYRRRRGVYKILGRLYFRLSEMAEAKSSEGEVEK